MLLMLLMLFALCDQAWKDLNLFLQNFVMNTFTSAELRRSVVEPYSTASAYNAGIVSNAAKTT